MPSQVDDHPHSHGITHQDGLALLILEGLMPWLYLVLAGLFEVVWAFSMKQSEGFTRLTPTLIMLITMVASFWLLAIAMRSISLGTAYVIWTGIGAMGAFLVGIFILSEPVNAMRLTAAVLIVSGLTLMQAASH